MENLPSCVTLPPQSLKGTGNSACLSSALCDGGVIRGGTLYFGGMLLPYTLESGRFDGSPVSYFTLNSVKRPPDAGWNSELFRMYYHEVLRFSWDPLEAAAFGDTRWHKTRFKMFIACACGAEILKFDALCYVPLFKSDNPDPVARLNDCFNSPHIFRLFGAEDIR